MKRKLLAILTVLLIVTMACSFLQPNSTPTSDGTTQDDSPDQGDQGDDESPPDTDDGDNGGGEPAGDDEGFSLDADALSQLDYYRSKIVMQYETGENDVDETVIDAAYIADPFAQHLIMESNNEGIELIQIGDQMWILFGDEWMQTSADEGEDIASGFGDFLMDSDDIANLQDSDYQFMGRETVNGVETRHYRANYTQPWMMAFMDDPDNVEIEDGTVDFWVVDESNLPEFVVKFELEMVGTANDENATFTLTQNITDINQPFTIDPPSQDELGGLPDGVTLYPDATDVTTLGGMTIFTSEDSVDDVAEFYFDALTSEGWEQTESMDLENMVTSSWEQDGETIQLTISAGDDDAGTSVMIVAGDE